MNRFHNKYHRHNHHSLPTAGEPDSAHDPIASKDSPFKGEFHVDGALSAVSASVKDLSVTNNLTVSGKATFEGKVDIHIPPSMIYEHLLLFPKATTDDYYFKIDSSFNKFPLMEVYLNGNTAFMITTAMDVGIGTSNPQAKLDVIGDIKCFNLSSINIFNSNNLKVSGQSQFNSLTADNTSRIGYLEIGYVKDQETYLKTVSGNRDLWFYTGDTLNLKMHPTGKNYFPGRVGIGMEPIEPLTLSGQMGFRTNGLVLLDNSYEDTLRIITNRGGEDDQHLFSFTYDGRYVMGDIFHDFKYPCTNWGTLGHKANIVDTHGSGNILALTNIGKGTQPTTQPATMRFFTAAGNLTELSAVSANEGIGALRAYGYNVETCWGDKNASIEFIAANNYTKDFQGAYTTFDTTCASDVTRTPVERMRIDHNGNVGINTRNYSSITPSSLSYRNTTKPDWKLTVRDYDRETRPAAVIFAGVAASPMMQVIGGEGQLEQTALMLSDRNINDANINHIEFTHGAADVKIARVSSLNRGAEGAGGGSLLFSTTYGLVPGIAGSTFSGIAVSPTTGDIIAADPVKNIIWQITPAGVATILAGTEGVSGADDGTGIAAKFSNPDGLTVDATGNVFVCDHNNNSIRRITSTGTVTTLATIDRPNGCAINPATGDLIVVTANTTSSPSGRIFSVTSTGTVTSLFPLAISSNFEGVAVGPTGDIFITVPTQHVVFKLSGGTFSTFAGTAGTPGLTDGTGTAATLNAPGDLSFDSGGDLIVGCNGSVRRITTAGVVSTISTTLGIATYQMALDASDNLYATNMGSEIRRMSSAGVVSTFVGSSGSGGSPTVLPFERARINFKGDMGIGIKTPNSRLHIHDDNKLVDQSSGTSRSVVTVSTLNNTNGILLSSADLRSSIYNNNNAKDLHITTSVTNGKIKFSTDIESPAVTITQEQNVGIGIDEAIDAITKTTLTPWVSSPNIKLGVNGDVMLFKDTAAAATVLAGVKGASGFADGAAVDARFSAVAGHMVFDATGNIIAADYDNNAVRRITPAGNATTLAIALPTGGLTPANFKSAGGVAVDSTGIIYATGVDSGTIIKIDTAGAVSIFASGLLQPWGLTVDAANNLYVAERTGHRIKKIDSAGVVTVVAGSGAAASTDGTGAAAAFISPVSIIRGMVGTDEVLFVCEEQNLRLITLSTGVVSTIATSSSLFAPWSMALNSTGDLFVADAAGIKRILTAGPLLGSIVEELRASTRSIAINTATNSLVFRSSSAIVTPAEGTARLFFNGDPSEVNTDPLYIHRTDIVNDKSELRVNIGNEFCIQPPATTVVTTLLGGTPGTSGSTDGATFAASSFNSPSKITQDSLGNIYIADTANHVIRQVTLTGSVNVFAGTVGAAGTTNGVGLVARFSSPRGIVCDSADNLYVIETGHAIRRITTNGAAPRTVTTFAGTIGTSGSNNGALLAATFNEPRAIAIDSGNVIYLAEGAGRRVRTINIGAGTVGTLAGSGVAGTADDIGTAATFDNLTGITIDEFKRILYVTENTVHIIRQIAIGSGRVSRVAGILNVPGAIDGLAAVATLTNPSDICLHSSDLIIVTATGVRLCDIRTKAVSTVVGSGALNIQNVNRVGSKLLTGGSDHAIRSVDNLGKPVAKYENEDLFTIGCYKDSPVNLEWNRWIDVGSCSTVFYNNISAMGDATFDNTVTIKGALSVVSDPSTPTKIFGDLYVDGNIYSTADITAFCGCTPPTGWPWPGPHPPKTSPPILSDERVKLNPRNITNSLEKIMLVNGVNFEWDETKQTDFVGTDVGVIAQEIEKILPEVVHERADGYKAVHYERIVPLLIECIKDLKKEIDLLKSL